MTVPAVAFPLTGMAAALVPTVHFYLCAHLFPLLGYVFWKAGAEFHSLWYLPSCSNIAYLFFPFLQRICIYWINYFFLHFQAGDLNILYFVFSFLVHNSSFIFYTNNTHSVQKIKTGYRICRNRREKITWNPTTIKIA